MTDTTDTVREHAISAPESLKPTCWWKNAKIYELYIDKFADDIRGLTGRLDYFEKLGVNCLHLLPHYPSPMADDGYDVSDYRSVRAELGTLEDFKQLLDTAHGSGIRIIVDFAFNHTSEEHPWFKAARSSPEHPLRDYYLWSKTGKEFPLAYNAMPDIKPSNWVFNQATQDYYYAKYYPQQPDLNWDNPEVFEQMMAHMEFWAAMGVDGFRMDAAPYIIKREGTDCASLPETHSVLKRIRARLEARHPECILLAEVREDLTETKRYFGDGDECHMAYNFVLMEKLWLAIMYRDMGRLKKAVEGSIDIPENSQWAIFLRNHDELTIFGLEGAERTSLLSLLSTDKRYLFNNGTDVSLRLGNIFNGDRAKIIEAFELLYSLPGSPVMYYGDEIGMLNLPHDPSIIDTRKYVRGAFDWAAAEHQLKEPDSLLNEIAKLMRRPNVEIIHKKAEAAVAGTTRTESPTTHIPS